MPLTDTAIRKAKPTEKPRKLYDSRGLYLEIAPRGTKAWRFKYRFAEKEKRISMGIYPEVSLKLARERRDDARKLLAREIDPSAYRKAQKQSKRQWASNSFEAVATEWLAKHSPNWSARYVWRIECDLGKDVFPWIGANPVAELTAPELLAALRRIEERGHLDMAHRTLQLCGRILRYAVATGRAERDVSWDLRGAFPPVKRRHFAAITDPKEVGPLLRLLDGYVGTLPVRCALRLAPLVFVRPGELRKAQWPDIDLNGGEWRYTVTKTDTPHVVPLARQAVEILREVHSLTGHGRYVFPNVRYPSRERPMSRATLWGAFRALDIRRDRMTPHGFRAMARTILDEVLGFRPDFIEHQLAHAVRDPNGRAYNRTAFLPERRHMMQAWADYLDRLKTGEEIEPGTLGSGLSHIPTSPGIRNADSWLDVPRQPTVWRSPQVRARSSGLARTHRLDGRRTGAPPPRSGAEPPSRVGIIGRERPRGDGGRGVKTHLRPNPYQALGLGGRSRHGRCGPHGAVHPGHGCARHGPASGYAGRPL